MTVQRSSPRPGTRSRKVSKGAARRRAGAAATLVAAQVSVGSFLRATRERLRLTQAEVAERTRDAPWQLSRAAVSAIERGQNFPGLEAMLALSNVLQIDPKELIERARLTAVVPVDISGLDDEELEDRAGQYFWAGDYKNALSVYDAMVQKLALEEHDEPERLAARLATVEVRRATTLKRAGALISAIASAERAIVLAAAVPAIQAEAYVVLADLQVQRGHLPLARDAAERAVDLAEKGGNTKALAWGWLVNGRVLFLAERYGDARDAFLEARRQVAISEDARHLTHIEGNVGMCLVADGELDEAREWIERAVNLARKHEQPALEASWLVEAGKIALRQERLDDADDLARSALGIARSRDHHLTIFRAEWLRHGIALLRNPDTPDRGRLDSLRELFRKLDQHEGIDEIQEFKQAILSTGA
jgi:transcriptional regulator with XRE-family HTH domain